MLRSHEEMQSGSPPFSGSPGFDSSNASALTIFVGVPGTKGTCGRFFSAGFSNGRVENSEVAGVVDAVEVEREVWELPLLDRRDELVDSEGWVLMGAIFRCSWNWV